MIADKNQGQELVAILETMAEEIINAYPTEPLKQLMIRMGARGFQFGARWFDDSLRANFAIKNAMSNDKD